MAKRLFLHVGTPKSGTTYLQSVLWANKPALKKQGLLLPLQRFQSHFHLSTIARDAPQQLSVLGPRQLKAWDRMEAEVSQWSGDALISHELFVYSSAERARWTTEKLSALCDELHIIVTARDLGRQVPAEWQETIKHGGTHGLHDYYELVRKRSRKIGFWSAQDLISLLTEWGAGLPPEQVHLVTLPPKGGPQNLLLERFCGLVGVDSALLDTSISRANESIGVAEIELLRRCNLHIPEDAPKHTRNHLTKTVLAEGILAKREGMQKFAPTPTDHAWAVEAGREIVEALGHLPYDVVGDLDDLVPNAQPESGPSPDDVTDHQVAEVGAETIPALLYGLGDELARARSAFQAERDLPLKTHVRRRLGLIKQKLSRRGS
jgi:hypothetical protein